MSLDSNECAQISSTTPLRKAQKSRRNPRACDSCHRRSVRCSPAGSGVSSCRNCVEFDEPCTFDRPARQRGRHRANGAPTSTPAATTSTPAATTSNPAATTSTPAANFASRSEQRDWTPPLAISQGLVMDLTDVFFEVVYPVFPLFHRPSLIRRVSRGEHLESRPLYASVAAMCALSSARARDGALLRHSWDASKIQDTSSEQLFEAAVDAIPQDMLAEQSLDYMRACLLLSITGIQYGSPAIMKYQLSRYHTYVAIGALHDEAHWPPGLSVIETEERRRLFWSAYTLDVFTSVVWGGVISSREASSNVKYPTETNDEDLETLRAETEHVSWLRGWNYVTDMYRILEYASSDLQRSRAVAVRTPVIEHLQGFGYPSQSVLLDRILNMYNDLPDIFKTAAPPTYDLRRDLYSFQAANIAATVQLVRMANFSSDTSTLEQKCQVAGDVLSAFARMPVQYLRAISAPLFHHLAEIGRIFGAAFSSGMSVSLYHSVRSVLLGLAALLANLEKKLCCPTDASKKVELQVMRIDRFIHEQSQTLREIDNVPSQLDANVDPEVGGSGSLALPESGSNQSLAIGFPPELFEDWDWAFTFT